VPNWFYIATNTVYHLGLAVWIGGAIALGALTAPALFHTLPRPQAGAIFGPILRRFARLRLAALVGVVVAAAVKNLVWETHARNAWIALRWAALAFMAFAVLYEIVWLERAIEARRIELRPELPEDHPTRRAFAVLHGRAEGLMKASVGAAVVAMIFG